MKHLLIIIFLSFFGTLCSSQTKTTLISNHTETIKTQAETMGKLLIKRDISSFIKFTYPKVIEIMGGESKMKELMETSSKQMELDGTTFLNVTFGQPSKIIITEQELQCTLPETIEMKVPNGRIIANSTLIAISTDNGNNWYFIDTSDKDIQAMRKILPNLSTELIIPKTEEPTFLEE